LVRYSPTQDFKNKIQLEGGNNDNNNNNYYLSFIISISGKTHIPIYRNENNHFLYQKDPGSPLERPSSFLEIINDFCKGFEPVSANLDIPIDYSVVPKNVMDYQGIIFDSPKINEYVNQKQLKLKDEHQRYQLGGENSTVVLAEYKNTLVAVKSLRIMDYSLRTERLKNLIHTNIITIIDRVDQYYIMELMETSLFDIIHNERKKAIDWNPEGKLFAINIISGLQFLHSFKIIHKDIKPPNILVRREGDKVVVKIGDLETARNEESQYTPVTHRISFKYAAPEQYECIQSLTTACDIYSFGVLLWEMVTGKIPWYNFEDKEIQKNDFMDKHRVIIENNIIKDIIEDCCKKEQKKRPGALSLIDRINKK